MQLLLDRIALVGRLVFASAEKLGTFMAFGGAVLQRMARNPIRCGRLDLLSPQLYQIGTRSIPVIALVGMFVGMVLAVESHPQFKAFGQEARLGGVINIAVVKQIGPVLAAVMIAGRVGGAISAQMGTMRVTEQLDAMRVMGVDPIRHLVAPRVLACLIMTPLLTVFSDLLGIFGGYFVSVRLLGVPGAAYWAFSESFITSWDVLTGIIKAVVFGGMIGLLSCYRGYMCGGGAAGVGRAATEAFVASFVAILVLNLFLAKFLNDLYDILYGTGAVKAFTG